MGVLHLFHFLFILPNLHPLFALFTYTKRMEKTKLKTRRAKFIDARESRIGWKWDRECGFSGGIWEVFGCFFRLFFFSAFLMVYSFSCFDGLSFLVFWIFDFNVYSGEFMSVLVFCDRVEMNEVMIYLCTVAILHSPFRMSFVESEA